MEAFGQFGKTSNYVNGHDQKKQVKLGFTRACRSVDKLGKKWLKTR